MSDDLPPDRLATRRLIELVGLLHRRGYEGVRLRPSLAPSGCYWRASLHSGRHPALTTRGYSTGAGWGLLFGWPDADERRGYIERVRADIARRRRADLCSSSAVVVEDLRICCRAGVSDCAESLSARTCFAPV